MQHRIESIEQYGIKAKGRQEYLKHLRGYRLTQQQAIHAKCYDCLGMYVDGKVDCRVPACPLYRYMPYRERHATGIPL